MPPSKDETTPIRRQYLDLKAKHTGAILFFRLGDFYETFDGDAELISRELEIVLTSRPVGKDSRVPMAGVPHHAADGYIARLIERGYRVAIAEQIGSEPVNGLVPREVRRVVTPGTVLEPGMLDAARPNYLAALVLTPTACGLSFVDISTGEYRATQLAGVLELERELARLLPREVLIAEGSEAPQRNGSYNPVYSKLPAYRFELANARQALLSQLKTPSLAGHGLEDKPLAARAAGAILSYLRETQPATLPQLTNLSHYSTSMYMALDDVTRRNLELAEPLRRDAQRRAGPAPTLLGVLDRTQTAMGARTLRAWVSQPLLERAAINERLDRVAVLHADALLRARIREALKNMPDMERLSNRALGGIATPKELLSLRAAAMQAGALVLELTGNPAVPAAFGLPADVSTLRDVVRVIGNALKEQGDEDGFIAPGHSDELDGIHFAVRDAKGWVANLERVERERSGIRSLKVGYNKVFGYYIEITHANTSEVPADYIRKQTLANAERYITPQLKEYETLILNADERVLELEKRLLSELNSVVGAHAPALLACAQAIARLDIAAALAETAARNKYSRPNLNEENRLSVTAGRHPVIEQLLNEIPFTPNDIQLDVAARIWVITGPNMSGKSSFMRQVALIVLMAQIGSFVPALAADLPIVDRIFTRIGAQDELTAGNSTFMVEMVETANILRHCTPRSLVVLDEIGRGTSTYDGLAIAWSVIEFLHNHPEHNAFTLFATHYHELIALADTLQHVRNFNVAVSDENDKIVFLHKVIPGGADRSYGVHVAELAGLPGSVIARAKSLLRQLEAGTIGHAPATPREPAPQLALFAEESPALAQLRALDPNSMSPIEALTVLFELKKMA